MIDGRAYMVETCRGLRNLLVFLVVCLTCHTLSAQEGNSRKKSPKTEQTPLTLKVPVDVIVVDATVTDGKRNPVLNLAADDFKIYDDGKLQPINTFSLDVRNLSSVRTEGGKNAAAQELPREQPAPSRPRMFSLVIDDVTSPADDNYVAASNALMKFVDSDMRSGDQAALLAGSGLDLYPFTDDRQLLREQIRKLSGKLSRVRSPKSTCPVLTDLQAQQIADEQHEGANQEIMELAVEETGDCLDIRQMPNWREMARTHSRSMAQLQWSEVERRSRVLIRTLRQHMRSLRHFQAAKSVILFSNGFTFQTLVYELQDVVDQALQSGIVVNTVDLRGLFTATSQASEIAHTRVDMVRVRQRVITEDLASRESTLNLLAHDTGGVFHHNSNDLYAGLHEISNRQTCTYVLTYLSPNLKADGRFHRIKLEVSRPDVQVSYRQGYYSPKEQLTFEQRRKEDIQEAMRAPGDVNEIPIDFSYNFYRADVDRYEVAFVVQFDLRRIQFLEQSSRRRNEITLAIVALDEAENYVDGSARTVEFNLTPSGYAELMNQGFASKASFQLAPGKYKIKAVVREGILSKIGSVTRTIEIP